jgi:hypothetical protein
LALFFLIAQVKVELISFDFVFHAGQQVDCAIGVATDPPVMEFFDRERVDVIPAKTPLASHDDKVGFFENAQVLHHGAPIQLPEVLD